MQISSFAGKKPSPNTLIDIHALIQAYYFNTPDSSIPEQRVEFGTSGHRGSSLKNSFNENHILAITQAICLHRIKEKINGPIFVGIDTHALSVPALKSAVEVFAANEVMVMLSEGDEYTPTPAISHAILAWNRKARKGFADGLVITPSHNPPNEGGFKYNSPNGGPAEPFVTDWIQNKANELLEKNLFGLKRIAYEQALQSPTTQRYNYLKEYVQDLVHVIDMDLIAKSQIHIGVDPLGGAAVHYWKYIKEIYKLNLTITNEIVDPTFSFMTVDWDGQIRIDPSSIYAMQGLIWMQDRFDIAFTCDTDADRHGIITKSAGLLPPNHYLSAVVFYIFQHRMQWGKQAGVGKSIVTTQMMDRVSRKLGRTLYEVPVGFKWFVDGLLNGALGFGGEESAGASFSRFDGRAWTTDKDGIILALLAAEITARLGKDPGEIYRGLIGEFGEPLYKRIEFPVTPEKKKALAKVSLEHLQIDILADEPVTAMFSKAPGNSASIGGLKVTSANGWFAARASGTENLYKIYGESFIGKSHLDRILQEAQVLLAQQ